MLAEHLKTQRRLKGFTQERLAEAAGLSKRTIARIEVGNPVQAETLLAVCSVLGLDHEALERMRQEEESQTVVLPVISTGAPSVARNIIPEATASLSEHPGIEFLALPDLAAWRATRNPAPGDDLNSMLFSRKAKFWSKVDNLLSLGLILLIIAGSILMTLAWNHKTLLGNILASIVFVVTMSVGYWSVMLTINKSGSRAVDANLESHVASSVYAFSRDSVRLVVVNESEVSVFRYDLSGKRKVTREETGGLVTYEIQTTAGHVTIHAVPLDARIDDLLMRKDKDDLVRRFPRYTALAA